MGQRASWQPEATLELLHLRAGPASGPPFGFHRGPSRLPSETSKLSHHLITLQRVWTLRGTAVVSWWWMGVLARGLGSSGSLQLLHVSTALLHTLAHAFLSCVHHSTPLTSFQIRFKLSPAPGPACLQTRGSSLLRSCSKSA